MSVTLFVIVVIALAFVVYLLIMQVGYFLIAASIGIGVAEGITYLKKTDAEFDDLYLERGRSWFRQLSPNQRKSIRTAKGQEGQGEHGATLAVPGNFGVG